MARLYGYGLYRPDRHGIFAFSGGRGRDKEAFLCTETGHRVSLARDLQVAGAKRTLAGQKISGRGELWRVSRATDDALSSIKAGPCYERPGPGESISKPGGRRWGSLADSLDGRPAVDNGRTSGVRRQADRRRDAAGDRVHSRRLRRGAT